MDFWGHLGALRTVLFKIALVVIIAAVALFIYMPWIFDHIVLAPCDGSFVTYHFFDAFRGDGTLLPNLSGEGFHLTLINYELTAQLNTHVSLAFWGAVVLCFPFIIYMLWTFVAPGLYPHERKSAVPAFVFGNIMFFLGILCCYYLVFPMCLKFLADYQITDSIKNTISLSSYISNFLMMNFLMGVAFEVPLLCWLLGKMGLITRTFFSKFRRHAIVVLVILAAIITPTGDPFTLLLVFIPLYCLWELSAWLVPKTRPEAE
ncbi:MAG: twin-arginine translocase subunit TatC [Bacteroidales bacterium]|nr:twin-arginine translocase subunit TatC [Bacteroidales bacterium]MDE6831194.1 twin-arginine translocase subunit TatC [Muribaculaceae bacterium]